MTLRFNWNSLTVKFSLLGLMVVGVSVFGVSYFIFREFSKNLEKSIGKELSGIASTASLLINPYEHEEIYFYYEGGEQIIVGMDFFDKIKKILLTIKRANSFSKAVYTLRKAENFDETREMIFIVMTDLGTNGKPYIGNRIKINQYMEEVYKTGKTQFTPLYKDYEGTWISGIAPLLYEGEVLGLISFDRDVAYVKREVGKLKKNVFVLSSIILAFGYFFLYIVQRPILKRIQRLSNMAENFGKGDYETPIKIKSNDEIGMFSAVLENTRVKIGTFITHILDILPGIMVTFDSKGSVLPHTSKMAKKILGENLTGKKISEMIVPKAKKEIFNNLLKLVFDPKRTMSFNDLMELGPSSLSIKDYEFQLEYIPIMGKNNNLSGIFIFGRDVTEEKKLKNQIQEEHKENRMIITLLQNRNIFQYFYTQTKEELSRANKILLNKRLSKEEINELFRITHTIKGSAGGLNLYSLAEPTHEFENDLSECREKGVINNPDDISEKFKGLAIILEEINLKLIKTAGDVREDKRGIESWEIEKLKDFINSDSKKDAISILNSLNNPSLYGYVVPKVKSLFEQARETVKKLVKLEINVEKRRIPLKVLKVLEVFLPHAIRNALDHGIEDKETRINNGKQIEGLVKVLAETKDDLFIIKISDDGIGIDPESIADVAVENGLITETEKNKLSDEKKIELIFSQGLTSKKDISEISGRGVGLDAVKRWVEREGGNLRVHSESGKGSLFSVELPI